MAFETSYNFNFDMLFSNLGLGKILEKPKTLLGGHLHKMFWLRSQSGEYAVKALNPQIMLRPKALQNYIDSENIAEIAAKNICAVAANRYNKMSVQNCDGQYYLIYNYLNGKSIGYDEITSEHCKKMGSILADIHKTDFSTLKLHDDYSSVEDNVDWHQYLKQGQRDNAVWLSTLTENLDKLILWNKRLVNSSAQLSLNTHISHGDLEPKNVLWDKAYIIDWEAAGYVHPAYDMLETAIYWAKEKNGDINEFKFKAFVNAYKLNFKLFDVDWNIVADKGYVMLGWLEYSLKRSLRIECSDEAEQKMGTEHIFGTIDNLKKYDELRFILIKWINDVKAQ